MLGVAHNKKECKRNYSQKIEVIVSKNKRQKESCPFCTGLRKRRRKNLL